MQGRNAGVLHTAFAEPDLDKYSIRLMLQKNCWGEPLGDHSIPAFDPLPQEPTQAIQIRKEREVIHPQHFQ